MVAKQLRSSCFKYAVRCSSRRVRLAQRQGLVYTQRHRDISQAYKTTTTRADAQEIVPPMHNLCFAEIHWTSPSMVVNQPPSQCSANAVGCSSRRVSWRQKPTWKPSRQPPKPSPSIQHHTSEHWPAKRTATHRHSRRQQWNTQPAPVQRSTQSAPHKSQWKTPWTKSVNHPNASDQPNQRVEQNRTNAPQCSPQLTKIVQNGSKRQLKPRKNTRKHLKSTFLFIKSDILCMLPRQMIKIGHSAPAQCGKWPKMFTGTFSPFLSAKINTNTITFFKIAIIYVQ